MMGRGQPTASVEFVFVYGDFQALLTVGSQDSALDAKWACIGRLIFAPRYEFDFHSFVINQ